MRTWGTPSGIRPTSRLQNVAVSSRLCARWVVLFQDHLLERRENRLLVAHIYAPREAVRKAKSERPFRIDA
jgi:hypothetical protein